MDTFRADVAAKMGKKVTPTTTTNTETTVSYSGVVTASVLRIRKGPSVSSSIAGTLKRGTGVSIILEDNGWGKLADGSGWVSLTYIKKNSTPANTFKSYRGKITASSGVNIRVGAGTNYNKNGALTYNSIVTIVDEKKVSGTTWGKLADGRGWISLDYLRKI
jgi:uncharacterized protein YgiM (DUF1202 family)